MKYLVFLLEEPSAKDFLESIVPRLVPDDVLLRFLVFEGKSDLEKSIKRKLQGWRLPNSGFVILRDQDAGECSVIKRRLLDLAPQSLKSRSLVRIACRELESWILGDWRAVAKAFERPNLDAHAQKALYRNPDELVNPVHELRKFIPGYQKRDGARRVGPLVDLDRNQSHSFRVFCEGVRTLASSLSPEPT